MYLDSCVVSESTYNHEALARALGRRISHVSSALSGPYSLRLPRLLTCVASFPSSREEVEKRIIVSPTFSVRVGEGGGGGDSAMQKSCSGLFFEPWVEMGVSACRSDGCVSVCALHSCICIHLNACYLRV